MLGLKRMELALLVTLLLSCRTAEPKQTLDDRHWAIPSAANGPASTTPSTPANVLPSPSALSPVQPGALPKLKPISSKPFPEGADEATVCEAIDSTERDLWVRFGHLVPTWMTGAVYVLETGPETKDKLYRYVSREYVWGYHSQQASCRGNTTLLYVRGLFDKSEYQGKPFGREHLGQAIEQKFGIKTRQSFQLENDDKRLAAYCRSDAENCRKLEDLDLANEGKGLCGTALAFIHSSTREPGYPGLLKRCLELPAAELACARFGFALENTRESARARESCRERIRRALGIEP
jgi:hypothetical protein